MFLPNNDETKTDGQDINDVLMLIGEDEVGDNRIDNSNVDCDKKKKKRKEDEFFLPFGSSSNMKDWWTSMFENGGTSSTVNNDDEYGSVVMSNSSEQSTSSSEATPTVGWSGWSVDKIKRRKVA